MDQSFLAIDLGAESGRVIRGTLAGGRIALQELHRFANVPVETPDGLHWDALRLYADALDGLAIAARDRSGHIAGIGVCAWGVDYAQLDARGRLLGSPYHYRDARTDGMPEGVAREISPEEQYRRTGIAQLPINTLYQLAAQRRAHDRTLELAATLLMIPDLLHYWLTGLRATELSIASTTGMLGLAGHWAADFLERLAIPTEMLLPPMPAGTVLGPVRPAVADRCAIGPVPVIAPAAHDTAAAVFAVPAERSAPGATHAYISSGTWSLLGLELTAPIAGEEARLAGFTNERGAAGVYCSLALIMGLWLVQECRRAWARRGLTMSYDELTVRAAAVESPGVAIDVDDTAFLHPPEMPAAIAAHLERAGQRPPSDPAALVRAILESLALRYAAAIEDAERLSGLSIDRIHVVGGGVRNHLLCQLTADASRRPVLAGPIEATALGNILVQAMGSGAIRDRDEARRIARASSTIERYEPHEGVDWAALRTRLAGRAARRRSAQE